MSDDLGRDGAREPGLPAMEPVGAADGAAQPAPAPTDPGDVALLALVDRLAALLERSELSELEIQVGGTGLVLRKPVAVVPAPAPAPSPVGGAAPAHEIPATSGAGTSPPRPAVMAPLTGIWYGSPSPGTAAYVMEGGEVAVGQVIGLIEAMKLFNEIKSDLAGRVVKVHAENGKLVKARQPLIEVEPL
jgi:acetyl-CoA carboxylase biotin carboxyl carrier protein